MIVDRRSSTGLQTDSVHFMRSSVERVRPDLKAVLIAAVVLTVLIAVMRIWVCWKNDRYVEFSAGVYIALAADLKSGLFYRPLLSSAGYGGTRYFPLYFVLYSLLLKLGFPVLLSGYLLSAAAIVLLILGSFSLMKRLGAEPWLAACCAAAVLAGYSVQWSLLSPHADGLACALNIWGLAVVAGSKATHRRTVLAAILFTLAWSTKITTVFGVAAAFLWLILTGSAKAAWLLACETACGYVIAGSMILLASGGRFFKILKADASGGTTLVTVLSGPFRMLTTAAREDLGFVLFLFLALLVFSVKSSRTLPGLFFITSIVVTAIIFGSPGTNFNQLLDVQVAAIILFATRIANKTAPIGKEVGVYALTLATILAAIPVLHKLRIEDRLLPAHRFEKVIALIGDAPAPILSENPALPVLAGQRPYVTDPWMLRLLIERTPFFGEPLLEQLRQRKFRAVVLSMRDPRSEDGRIWYEKENFGPGFLAALNQNYQLTSIVGGQFVYLPDRGKEMPPRSP